MRKNSLNFVVDFFTFLIMLGMISTGLLIAYVLPPKTGQKLSIWGLERHDWGEVHFWLAFVLLALLLLHVALHWSWICIVIQKLFTPPTDTFKPAKRWRRHLYGIATMAALVALIGGFQWIANANVKENPDARGRQRNPTQATHQEPEPAGSERINGSMTLRELASTSGLSIKRIIKELNLPAEVATDARLGRLRRDHGFRMSDVRRLAAESKSYRAGNTSAPTREECRDDVP